MKIALVSHFFYPSVGGTEEVAQVLASQFVKLGHEVRVLTTTPCSRGHNDASFSESGPCRWPLRGRRSKRSDAGKCPLPNGTNTDGLTEAIYSRGLSEAIYKVLRQPSPLELWDTLKWSEVVLHNNLCLRMAWPLLVLRKPWVVAHHIWTRRMDGRRGLRDRLKLFAVRRAKNIAVSNAIARDLPVPAEVIGNPYRDEIYRPLQEVVRSKPLLFVGRLTAGKGLDLLIQALGILEKRGTRIPLTVVGDGPDRASLESLAKDQLGDIQFVGRKSPEELARIYNEHQFLVIPSVWNEPFGLVALEAIACGCQPIGAEDGGLPEAIGPCGRIFPRGNAEALAELLAAGPLPVPDFDSKAVRHLARFKAEAVARAYLRLMEEVAR